MNIAQTSATYIDHMGSDLSVVNAARASFDKESEWLSTALGVPYPGYKIQMKHRFGAGPLGSACLKETDAKLIRFLARGYRTDEWADLVDSLTECGESEPIERILLEFKNKAQHWAPFGHPHVTLRVEMPIFLARQFVKHQVGGVWSEMSRRYVSDNLEFWFPDMWRSRPQDVKQGSGDPVADQQTCTDVAVRSTERALAAYQTLLAEGVTPEEARMVLPHNLMTTVIWTGSLLFWARVVNQRVEVHAQRAAQELGRKIAEQIRPYFPVCWAELVGEK